MFSCSDSAATPDSSQSSTLPAISTCLKRMHYMLRLTVNVIKSVRFALLAELVELLRCVTIQPDLAALEQFNEVLDVE